MQYSYIYIYLLILCYVDGLQPTDYTFSVLANVCVKSGQLNRAYGIVEMAKKYEVTVGNVSTYNTS
jgi:hypothetical protein